MARHPVVVRKLDADHRAAFVDLWIAGRIEAGQPPAAAQRISLDGRLATALETGGVSVYLAFTDGEAVGYAVLSESSATVLLDAPALTIEQLYVTQGARKHGVARALLLAIATRAERCGAEIIATNVPAQVRDANRFFARLGFTPQVVRRATPTAALLRRLAGPEARPAVDRAVLRRRVARLRSGRAHLVG